MSACCGICSQAFGYKRRPICVSCALTTIYQSRHHQAQILIQCRTSSNNVTLHIDAEKGIGCLPAAAQTVELTESANKSRHEQQKSQTELIDQRLAAIRLQQQALRDLIAEAKASNTERHGSLAKATCELQSAKLELNQSYAEDCAQAKADLLRSNTRLAKVRSRIADGRLKLCRETARLASLNVRRRRTSDATIESEYMLGGLPLPDLRNINTVRPDRLSASLANICRLLAVTCHYLSVRLPAEIVMPGPDRAVPTIMSIQSSFRVQDESNRVAAGKSRLPTARLLSIDKSLPKLAKDDMPTYNLAVEGVILLAWNVAWLCKVQGAADISSWEDVCCIGSNLYRLFASSGTKDSSTFGKYSHDTVASNLAGPAGVQLMSRPPALPTLISVTDKIKSHLLTEMSSAEWELLESKEWMEDRDDERAVLVGVANAAISPKTRQSAISKTSMTTMGSVKTATSDDV